MQYPDRKSQAEYIMKYHKDISGVIFGLLDDKAVDDRIWKMVKPKHELPFKQEEHAKE